jgi:hypothetical protein
LWEKRAFTYDDGDVCTTFTYDDDDSHTASADGHAASADGHARTDGDRDINSDRDGLAGGHS